MARLPVAVALSGAGSEDWIELGGNCEVFSKSTKLWFPGTIEETGWKLDRGTGAKRQTLSVTYEVRGDILSKKVFADDSRAVRELKPGGDKVEYCLCSSELVHIIASGALDEHRACMMCAVELKEGDDYFECPKGATEFHNKGYVRCWKCISDEAKLYPKYMTEDMVSEECRTTEGTLAQLVADKPFAKGSTCLVYLGVYKIPSKMGKACVIKKLQRKHPYTDEEWKADMSCVTKAHELVTAWNEAAIVPKPFEMIVPHIGRRGGGRTDALMEMLLGLLLLGHEDEDERKEMYEALTRDKLGDTDTDAGDEEIAGGECVVVEDFLVGHFAKWNSNAGWCSEQTARFSVQAFCHWTFHDSKGQCLFCDAQGIRREERYLITDPAICSTVVGQYGATDLGPLGMYAWFLTHRCGDYCKSEWLKPTQVQLDSVPPAYRKLSKVRATQTVLSDFISKIVRTPLTTSRMSADTATWFQQEEYKTVADGSESGDSEEMMDAE